MSSTLVRSRYLITNASHGGPPVLENGALYQQDGRIVAVGPYDDLKPRYAQAPELGGSDYLLFPGLVSAHHHGSGYSSLQQGRAEGSLELRLFQGLARRRLSPYLNTLYACAKMIESGVTCSLHHAYAAGDAETYAAAMQDVLRAHADARMRVALAVAVSDQNALVYEDDQKFLATLPPELQRGMAALLMHRGIPADGYFQVFQHLREAHADSQLVRILLGPAGLQWCSDELLTRIAEAAGLAKAGIHLHAVESPYQKEYAVRRFGRTAFAHLHELGVLGPRTSCAHCVWVTESDLEILADTQTTVVHNPSSNLRLGCGTAPVLPMLQRGVNVALGTDGSTLNDDDDMLQEIRLCLRLHRPIGLRAEHLSPGQALAMATVAGARAAQFEDQIGRLTAGRRADLVLLRMHGLVPTSLAVTDVLQAFLLRAKSTSIDTVMIDGQIVLREGALTAIDKEAVEAELAAEASQERTGGEREREQLIAAAIPYMVRFYEDWTLPAGQPFYQVNSRT